MAGVLNNSPAMNVLKYVLFFGLAFSAAFSQADELEKCLSAVSTSAHRLEREDAVARCFTSFTQMTGKDACFGHIEKYKSLVNSTRLQNLALNSCFYESTGYKTMQDCMGDTKLFKKASDHDEAIFFCYQSFEERLSKQECSNTAKKLIFPAKRDYLLNHCQEI
jgi:hypothetical protein